jgi:hypothetical protein
MEEIDTYNAVRVSSFHVGALIIVFGRRRDSNLGRDTEYAPIFHGLPQSFQAVAGLVPQIVSRWLSPLLFLY